MLLKAQTTPIDAWAEHVRQSSHIIVGTVQQNPLLPCDPTAIVWASVEVERYLKGTGPALIRVMSADGACVPRPPHDHVRFMELPAPGSRVLLFLTGFNVQDFEPSVFGIVGLGPENEVDVVRRVELIVE